MMRWGLSSAMGMTRPGGLSVQIGGLFTPPYTYNETGQITQQSHYNKSTNTILASFSYTLDKVGNRIAAIESIPWVTSPVQQITEFPYSYDKLYHLTFAEYTALIEPSYTYNYSYDAMRWGT